MVSTTAIAASTTNAVSEDAALATVGTTAEQEIGDDDRYYAPTSAGAASVRAGYPRLDEFARVRDLVDPGRRFASLLSRRLDL